MRSRPSSDSANASVSVTWPSCPELGEHNSPKSSRERSPVVEGEREGGKEGIDGKATGKRLDCVPSGGMMNGQRAC